MHKNIHTKPTCSALYEQWLFTTESSQCNAVKSGENAPQVHITYIHEEGYSKRRDGKLSSSLLRYVVCSRVCVTATQHNNNASLRTKVHSAPSLRSLSPIISDTSLSFADKDCFSLFDARHLARISDQVIKL